MVLIREIQENDAEGFLDLCQRLDEETQFMMLEPGERLITVTEQRERIQRILLRENQTILVAEAGNRLVGYLAAFGGDYRRNRHNAHIVIGILQGFAGQGIGTRLFAELDDWARRQGVHRLELTVMAHNTAALSLYKKMGFENEGTKKDSLFVGGQYVDEYYMAKLLA
ncbi:MAG TPA: GNAT family protein [Anaerolineales bacterium]|nr:GNAT family protein [Anaerolineales bacterium]